MSDPLDRTLAAAIAAGILPADAARPADEARPWPVVLLTALGAWLAAIPLVMALGLLLGDRLLHGPDAYVAGFLVLAAAAVTLRSSSLPLFVEQLAVPGLLVGLGTLGFALGDDLPKETAHALVGVLTLTLAALLPRPWLRVLLGAAAACLFVLALTLALLAPRDLFALGGAGRTWGWLALHLVLGAWLIGLFAERGLLGSRATIPAAAALESISAGWLVATLAGLALWSGMTMLVGAGLDPGIRDLATDLAARDREPLSPAWVPAGSVLLALVATLWGARRWPGLRQPWVLGVGAGMAGLAWFLPSLGGVWLALVVTATSGRSRLAGAAALAAAWTIGSFYYQLQWPLAHKALVLAGVGASLGGLVWLRSGLRAGSGDDREQESNLAATAHPGRGWAPWLIALAALATLAVVNVGIWQKETLIAAGQPVFVELVPVDPRSLMQGDFMRLAYRLPAGLESQLGLLTRGHPQVVAHRDAHGVATLLSLHHPGEPLAEDEMLIELTPKGGRWTLVTDAWFFREGDAARWQAARFGEFRVTPNGRALLVGLADAELRPIAAGD